MGKRKGYTMKKCVLVCLCALIAFSVFTGCHSLPDHNADDSGETVTAKSEASNLQNSPQIKSKPNFNGMTIMEVHSTLDMAYQATMEKISDYADNVVIGTVTNVSYTQVEGHAWTVTEIDINTKIKGSLDKAHIQIYSIGGYIPLKNKIDFYDDAFRFENMTEQEINNTVVHEIINGETTPPQIGNQYLFYLVPTSKHSPLPDGVFERCGGKDGQFDVNEPNVFTRTLTEGNQSEKYTIDQIKSYLK